MRKLIFTVPGTPKGKGRPRATMRGGHAAMYTPATTASYDNLVKIAAQEAAIKDGVIVISQPVAVMIVAKFLPPKSWSQKKKTEAVRFSIALPGGKATGNPVDSGFLFSVEDFQQAMMDFSLVVGEEFLRHTSRPDLDNIVKAVLDGMNGSLLADDALVWVTLAAKIYSETPGVDVGVFWGAGEVEQLNGKT